MAKQKAGAVERTPWLAVLHGERAKIVEFASRRRISDEILHKLIREIAPR